MADDPITTQWVEVFDSCTRYSKATTFAEYSRDDACAAPVHATESLCTWIAALGHACAYRGLAVPWMSDQDLYDYCTDPGMINRRINYLIAFKHVFGTCLDVRPATMQRTSGGVCRAQLCCQNEPKEII